MNVACIIAYDGSKFCGFSPQSHDTFSIHNKRYGQAKTHCNKEGQMLMSVAGFFELILQRIGIKTHIIGSGRTDKGVHATYQVINFHAQIFMSLEKMQKLLNDRLYPFVLIKKIFFVDDCFHARFSAKMRFYKYIFTQNEILPFYTSYIAKVKYGDIMLLKQALGKFCGEHDFSLFKKNGSETTNFVRQIYKAHLFPATIHHIKCYVAHIGANGFLRSQVRMMMQACFEVSLGRISIKDLEQQIDNKLSLNDKACVRSLAPANGLYLSRVIY